MANIQVFEYQNSKVRTVDIDGEAWFVLKDVCAVLGISNNRMAADRLDDDEKGVSLIDTLGGKQEMVIVNESGLYHVILRSDKPEAAPFRRWVTNDVLPAIRKTGSYNAPQLTRSQLLATALIAAHEELEQKDKQIETMKPKALFADAVSASKRAFWLVKWQSCYLRTALTSVRTACLTGYAGMAISSKTRNVAITTCLHSGVWRWGCLKSKRPRFSTATTFLSTALRRFPVAAKSTL